MQRRHFIKSGAMLAAQAMGCCALVRAASGSGTRRIAIVASRYAFSVQQIRARAGESLVLVLTATDFTHGFSLPQLNTRVDIPPGAPVELMLRSLAAGRYTYLCDNFCGEGH